MWVYLRECAIWQKKKNKSYSDGVLEVKQGNACTLFNEVKGPASPGLLLTQSVHSAYQQLPCPCLTQRCNHVQEGKVVSKSKVKDTWGMPAGAELEMGNWELQVDATMDEQHFRSPSQYQGRLPGSLRIHQLSTH